MADFSTKKHWLSGSTYGGYVQGLTWHKSITGSRHILRHPRKAIAFDVGHLDQARSLGVTLIVVRDRESGVTYTTPFENLDQRGFDVNRGHGSQRGLELMFWASSIAQGSRALRAGEYRQRQAEEPRPARVKRLPVQLPLFGGKQ